MVRYYFVSYSAQSINKPSLPAFGNLVLKVSSDRNFLAIRQLENQLNEQNPTLNHVILNYQKITRQQYNLEMKTTHPRTHKIKG